MTRKNENGSAITEFVIALLTLVPMVTLFTLIGKLSDAEHAAQDGARYQAWEMALGDSTSNRVEDLKSEVHQRVFESKAFIQSTDKSIDSEAHPNRHLWGMYGPASGSGKEALFSFDEFGYENKLVNNAAGLSLYAPKVNVFGIGEVGLTDLEEDGLYNAKVGLAVNDVSWLGYSGKITCGNGSRDDYLTCIDRNNAVLVDDWSAGSPTVVESGVADLNPQLFLWKPFAEDVLDKVLADPVIPIRILTPAFDWYEPFEDLKYVKEAPGYVEPDRVPAHRLGSYQREGISRTLD